MQIYNYKTTGGSYRGVKADSQYDGAVNAVSNSIVMTNDGVDDSGLIMFDYCSGADFERYGYAINNIVYSIDGSGDGIVNGDSDWDVFAYNNTVLNVSNGFLKWYNGGTLEMINNIAQDCDDGFNYTGYIGESDFNISDISADTTGGDHDAIGNVQFTDDANYDFHIDAHDGIAINAGTSSVLWIMELPGMSNIAYDIDGDLRRYAAVSSSSPTSIDIGADEASKEYVAVVDPGGGSGHDFDSLSLWNSAIASNIATTSTLVFSYSSASGTIPDLATVIGETSGAIATSVHMTATTTLTGSAQLLFTNITRSTSSGQAFLSGEKVYVKGASATANYAYLSSSGDSAVATAKCRTSDGSADVTAVTISGWTTGAKNYVKVWTDPDEYYRHNGVWDEGKYRLDYTTTADYESVISIEEDYVRLDGLQAKINYGYNQNFVINIPNSTLNNNEIHISNTIAKGITRGSSLYGAGFRTNTSNTKAKIWNNIAYDFKDQNNSDGYGFLLQAVNGSNDVLVYNNTAVNCYYGFYDSGGGGLILKNNIAQNCTDGYYGPFDSDSDYNISDITGDTTGGSHDLIGNVHFADEANEDFHLDSADTNARGKGTSTLLDSGSESGMTVVDDIDGHTRPLAAGIDIGADQVVTRIYRSVGPGATGALSAGATSGDLEIAPKYLAGSTTSIADYVATFASEQPTNVGVGDVIQYDKDDGGTIDSIAFITRRYDNYHYSVRTATGSAPYLTTVPDADWSVFRAYTSLANAESGDANADENNSINDTVENFDNWSYGRDLIANAEQWNIACYADGTTADGSEVYISGWTTSADDYIRIYTPTRSEEVGASQRHEGKWDTTKYYLSKTDLNTYLGTLDISEDFVRVEGLQIQIAMTTSYIRGIYIGVQNPANDIRISSNIIRQGSAPSGSGTYGIVIEDTDTKASIWNNVIYDFTYGSIGQGIRMISSDNVYIYNNTVQNCSTGIQRSAGTVLIKNNLTGGCTSAFSGTFDGGSSYNAGYDSSIYFGKVADSGNTDGIGGSANVLRDSGQDFLTTVKVGMVVMNTTDSSGAYVTGIASNTEVSLSSDIMDDGENYIIYSNFAAQPIFFNESGDDFHLSPLDTGARNRGADLTNDMAWRKMMFDDAGYGMVGGTDIDDGDTSYMSYRSYTTDPSRPYNTLWDIGADELIAKQYRSVAPLETNPISTGGTITVASSTGTATFSTARPDNVGIGDAIVYNSSSSLAFIIERASSTEYTVRTSSGTLPAYYSGTDYHIYRAYTSLANAEAGIENTGIPLTLRNFDNWTVGGDAATDDVGQNIASTSEQWNIAVYSGSATSTDGTQVDVNGWTTKPENYIRIFTPHIATEAGASQRHAGKWDSAKYQLVISNVDLLTLQDDHIRIDGLQMQTSYSGGGTVQVIPAGNLAAGSKHYYSNNLIYSPTVSAGNTVHGIYLGDADATFYIWNNILYGFNRGAGLIIDYGTAYVYNNTAISNLQGFYENYNGTAFFRNNLAQSNSEVDYYTYGSGYGHEHNISQDASSPNADLQSKTAVFVDSTNSDSRARDYHLSVNDLVARDSGTSLSSAGEGWGEVIYDIDNDTRPAADFIGTWDIGADEATTTPIYRSVSPGVTSALQCGGGSVGMAISAITGTSNFQSPISNNIGVGDAIVYNSSSSIAFISGRSISTQFSVRSSSGGAPTSISTTTTWCIFRAYTSLDNAVGSTNGGTENAGIPSAVRNFDTFSGGKNIALSSEQWNVACYASTSPDTTAVTIDGWTTSATNYLKIYTPTAATEVGTSQRHAGKWDDAKYNLIASAGWSAILTIYENYVRIDGLQVANSVARANQPYEIMIYTADSTDSDIQISNNILKTTGTGTFDDNSCGLFLIGGVNYNIWNNIIYDTNRGISLPYKIAALSWNIYNNTIINAAYTGFNSNGDGSVVTRIYNNIIQGVSSEGNYSLITGTYYSGNNISEDMTSPNSGSSDCDGHSCRNQIALFVDEANNDFHLSPFDTAAMDAGTSSVLSSGLTGIEYDIDGDARPAYGVDIGADEGSARGEFVSVVDPGGTGDYSSLSDWQSAVHADLTASTTRVFSYATSTFNGFIPDGSSVVGLTSGAVATATHQTATATPGAAFKLLLTNISGSFLAGEKVYIQGQATTSNYVYLSSYGAAPIAVAKCRTTDGSADTAAVNITGWTTSADNYIKIWTDPSEDYRHSGMWDEGKYKMEVDSIEGDILSLRESNLVIDGLQLKVEGNYSVAAMYGYLGNASNITIKNNIIRNSGNSSSTYNSGIRGFVDNYGDIVIVNNVIYDFKNGGIETTNSVQGNSYAFNNTIFNCGDIGVKDGYGDIIAINNLAYGNTANYSGSFNSLSANNLSGPSLSDAPGNSPQNAKIIIFADEAKDDFHLSETDTSARNAGTSTFPGIASSLSLLAMTEGIDGTARGAAYDIGADEVPTEYISILKDTDQNADYHILADWEDAVECDLTASSTRVFSGYLTGSLSENDTVGLITAAGVSLNATGTIVATTSAGQVLIDGIYGTSSPIFAASGTRWRKDASSYFSIQGIGDALGASPIAVAKIDGAWAGADTAEIALNGWTTDRDNYIRIYTAEAARHGGKWSDTGYRMVISAYGNIVDVREGFVRIDGLQLYGNYHDGINGIYLSELAGDADVRVSNSIIKGPATSSGETYGIDAPRSDGQALKLWNNIIYDWNDTANNAWGIYFNGNNGTSEVQAYNNTLINNKYGISSWGDQGNMVLKNNLCQDNGQDYNLLTSNNTTVANISSDASSPDTAFRNMNVRFVSTSTDDFHLAQTDGYARDKGVNIYADLTLPLDIRTALSTDIDGNTRNAGAANWDIGADQYTPAIKKKLQGHIEMQGHINFR